MTGIERDGHLAIRQENVDALERLVEFLVNELVHTRLKWRVYRAFYGTNNERVELLNGVSGTTAGIIQDALYDDVILSLCRSADAARSAGKSNNSFASLLSFLDDVPFKKDLSGRIKVFQGLCRPLRDRRNWHVAHSDREATFSETQMGGVSRSDVEACIEVARSTLVVVYSAVFNTQISTELVSGHNDDEVAFLRTIYHGRERLAAIEVEALSMVALPADSRRTPPEIRALRELHEKPEWLNYRPPPRHD
ncbi:hypothetical protein [Paracoccus salsus]|uniref:AbiU2 domain-containing protein n=1 Tax=Paracoccus salsus TaxID=2911061 RepID=UPI001F4000DF|nr:hypothetical protein [Paracoccus salsus]MCF3972299.1 hypothetical protein [Paracoccus salsus]